MRRFLRQNSLGVFFGAILLLSLVGQAVAGLAEFNAQQKAQGLAQLALGRYLTSSDYAADITENWQSEYLQFLLYILATVWFVQKGSSESKQLDELGSQSDQDQKLGSYTEPDSPAWAKAGGLRTLVFSWSLTIVMGSIFFASWFVQSVAGWSAYNEQRLQQTQDPFSWPRYLAASDFWGRTLQNWQSEFLAVGTMAVFSIYLRQRGSPESKPVGEPHDATGVSG